MSQTYDDHTGRQDVASPGVTVEKSDPTPVDQKRGARMWLGVTLVGVVFLVIIIAVLIQRS